MLAIKQFMDVFFEKTKTSSKVMWGSYLLYFILANAERLLFNTALSHMLLVIPLLFIITLNYESSILRRLAATVTNYAVFTVAVIFVFIPAYQLVGEEYLYIVEFSLGSLLSFLIAFNFKRFKKIRRNHVSSPLFWALMLSLPATVMTVLVLTNLGLSDLAASLSFIFLLGANLLIFFVYENLSAVYEDKQKQKLDAQEKEYYFAQCQTMQESIEQMKAFKHDVKSHLAMAKDYAANGKPEETAAYLNTLLEDISEIDTYSETGNIAFDSIINYKLRNAKTEQIELDLTLAIPPVLNVDMVDVVTILSNLLSNALEGVEKVENKAIKLDIEFSKGCLFIKIENSFDGVVDYSEGQIVSRKEKKDSHGYGLQNIRQSAEKYNGQVKISHENGLFSVVVFLYVDEG